MTSSSFIVIFHNNNYICSVVDIRNNGPLRLHLPGGKINKKETHREAAIRECFEEGWDISECTISEYPFLSSFIERKQKHIYWFFVTSGLPKIIKPQNQSKNLPITISISHFVEHYSICEFNRNAVLTAKKLLNI